MNEQILLPQKKEYRVNVENVTVTMLVSEEYTPHRQGDASATLHTHSSTELFVCTKGAIQLQTRQGILTLHAGDVAFVPPALLHCMLSDTTGAEWHVFDFICTVKRQTGRMNLMQRLVSLLDTDHLTLVRGAHAEAAELARIARERDDTEYLSALRFLCVLCALARHDVQRASGESETHATLFDAFSERDIDRLSKLDYLVNVYYMTDLSVARAAELLFVSERHLQRITRKEYGMTFAQLLCKTRLSAAKTLLADPSLTLEQIALATGFSSRAALARAMQREYGITPAEYREKLTPSAD